jgi:hypothetical protein
MAEAGFCGGNHLTLAYTLAAVNVAIAKVGEKAAWRRLPASGFGVVPDLIWLDTGEPPSM